jgi:L-threonylcarbamoyladenylate synthase
MPCQVVQVNPQSPNADAIARAARILQAGGLVAFPTETVYGLGANALDVAAVAKIFAAKGRPATNPIIVHVADIDDARPLVSAWPDIAQKLAERFWPGPLTLVLPKHQGVPELVTAGGPTVAVRVPAHPVALTLLRACRLPLAAPSANRSTELSPTRAEHVLRGLSAAIDLLLDAGPTTGGLESTVLDLTADPPRQLRPGLVTVAELEALIGPIDQTASANEEEPLRSPGQMQRHYAPRTPLEVTRDSRCRVEELRRQGLRVGWLTHIDQGEMPAVWRLLLPDDAVSYAALLYAALHDLDGAGLDRIVVETPPAGDEWLAIHDRLRRAANRADFV